MTGGIPDDSVCDFCSFFRREAGYDKRGKWNEQLFCVWFGGELTPVGPKGEFDHSGARRGYCKKKYPHGASIQLVDDV